MGGWKRPLPRSTSLALRPSGICWISDILLALSRRDATINRALNWECAGSLLDVVRNQQSAEGGRQTMDAF
jgi:hypothetical protein